MRKRKKKDLEVNLDEMIIATLGLLEDLHIVHKKTAFEELLSHKIPGADITVAKLVNNLFKIISPVIDIARSKYPALFVVIEWAQEIVFKLLKD